MNYETEAGAVLVMAAGVYFYATMEMGIVGSVLVIVGAGALILPRFVEVEGRAAR